MEFVAPALRKKHSLAERIFGALLLRTEIYDEVKRDAEATWQGVVFVLLAELCFIWTSLHNPYRLAFSFVVLVSWPLATAWFFMWAKHVFARDTTWDMADWLLRTLAYSYAPRFLYGIQPFLYASTWWPFDLAIYFWQLVMTIVALRHSLEISIGRAIWVWLGTVILSTVLLNVLVIALMLAWHFILYEYNLWT
jgi:hypothetical protein